MKTEAKPLQVGVVAIRPHFDQTFTFSDNIFIAHSNRKADGYFTAMPGFEFTFGRGNFQPTVNYTAGFSKFIENSSQDSFSQTVSFSLSKDQYVKFGPLQVGATLGLSDARDANTIVGERVEGLNLNASVSLLYDLTGKWNMGVTWTPTLTTFKKSQFIDNQANAVVMSLGYNVSPRTRIFADGGVTMISPDSGSESEGYTAGVGVSGEIFTKMSGSFRVGYGYNEITGITGGTTETVVLNGNLSYSLGPKTTLGLNASRAINASVSEINNTYINTGASLGLTHMFSDKLSGNASFAYNHLQYENPSVDPNGVFKLREDDLYTVTLGVSYNFTEWLRAYANYTFRDNESNSSFYQFYENRVVLGAGVSF
ncbi:MAG: outer membrane beta-barrel protein [Verrucomicrobiae bacterium]|nr:outer membrane beta-barrel protein [Verrucomicrobiae bacterium]